MMSSQNGTVLVFGATGQQGGSVTKALLSNGWRVRALMRDPESPKAVALRDAGVEAVRGDLSDRASLTAAMVGTYGVFSVQPSSGQGALYSVSDEEKVRYGKAIADLAVEAGVRHLVYSSANAAGQGPTGMGHFDSKSRIEDHIRSLAITTTVIRPSAFMEILMMPGFGLPEGCFNFFMRPDQSMQFIAVEDIGRIVAAIFADPDGFRSRTIELAGDALTGEELGSRFTDLAGHTITYQRFPDDVLKDNAFLEGLTHLVDDSRLAGHADLGELRRLVPELQTFGEWLAGAGRKPFERAVNAREQWAYGSVK